MTQSVISAYEAGKRQPAMPTLATLIDAAGCELSLNVHRYSDDIHHLRVFGSVARGEEHATSDLDLLADFGNKVSMFVLAQACDALESVVRTQVDLVGARNLKPALRHQVHAEAVVL